MNNISNEKNFMLFGILALLIISFFGLYDFFQNTPVPTEQLENDNKKVTTFTHDNTVLDKIIKVNTENTQTLPQDNSHIIEIKSGNIVGKINLIGGNIQNVFLKKYDVTTSQKKPVQIIGEKQPYVKLLSGWSIDKRSSTKVLPLNTPDDNTLWSTTDANAKLTPTTPVVITWQNNQGISFTKTFTMDSNYVIDISLLVSNNSESTIKMFSYALFKTKNSNNTISSTVTNSRNAHVYFSETYNPEDLFKNSQTNMSNKGGWISLSDSPFWFSSIIAMHGVPVSLIATAEKDPDGKLAIKTGIVDTNTQELLPNEEWKTKYKVFVGPKKKVVLENYEKNKNFPNFSKNANRGILAPLVNPILSLIILLKQYINNMGILILVVTVIMQIILIPLTISAKKTTEGLKKLQPALQIIQKEFENNKEEMKRQIIAKYRECRIKLSHVILLILLQITVFFIMSNILGSVEFRHKPLFWISDITAPDPFNLLAFTHAFLPTWFHLKISIMPIIATLGIIIQMHENAPTTSVYLKLFLAMLFPLVFSQIAVGTLWFIMVNTLMTTVVNLGYKGYVSSRYKHNKFPSQQT